MELMEQVCGALGLGSPEQLSERNWFALRNFHCHWFEDSAKLNEFLNFQTMGGCPVYRFDQAAPV